MGAMGVFWPTMGEMMIIETSWAIEWLICHFFKGILVIVFDIYWVCNNGGAVRGWNNSNGENRCFYVGILCQIMLVKMGPQWYRWRAFYHLERVS